MNKRLLLSWSAAVACAAGVALTAQSWLRAPDQRRQLKRKTDDLRELHALSRQEAHDLEAVAAFERLPSSHAASLNDLASAAVPAVQPTIRPRESRPAAQGWTVRSLEMSFPEIWLTDFAKIAEKAAEESGRPPWRLSELAVTASQGQPGAGRVTAVFEALEKKDSSR